MDANTGWFRFKNEADFKRWLPFYFRKMDYDHTLPEYIIAAYGTTKPKPESRFNKFLTRAGHILDHLVYKPLVRYPYYAAAALWDMFKSEAKKPVKTPATGGETARESRPTYSSDDMQVGLRSSSYLQIAEELDISLQKKQHCCSETHQHKTCHHQIRCCCSGFIRASNCSPAQILI